jgi:uncharacterized integral membrane protein (TIGR00697 family)
VKESPIPRSEKAYLAIAAAFSVFLILTNLIGTKLFQVPFPEGGALPASIVIYPFTFAMTDVVAEIWGVRRANLMVYLGFSFSVLALALVLLVIKLQPHEVWVATNNAFGFTTAAEYQNAFESILIVGSKSIIASMIAFMVAQLIDIRIFHLLKQLTKGKYLWLRNNASTLVSQVFDTTIVSFIILYWGLGLAFEQVVTLAAISYGYKALVAVCDTPVVYFGVFLIRRYIGRSNAVQV